MRWLAGIVILALLVWAALPKLRPYLPPGYDPLAPLSVDDPPTFVTRYKLRQLSADIPACLEVLAQARQAGRISYSLPGDTKGTCPLASPVRVQGFGPVSLSSSFLASCPLALSSAMFVSQSARPQAQAVLGTALTRVDHLGSYACRTIYSRPGARLSEHASAEALDLSAFRFADGRRVTVLAGWQQEGQPTAYLKTIFSQSCRYYGNSIGPDYNTAHANHFHLGMRGFGVCR
ncbi:extensin-like domain-containing protein [Biostraticola tofi]|uniref:Extensin-like C-terminal domain-containing protein n=1 Tax=Biostraticola tofi TaxID=466109 RepID=A0A4R3YPS6_9GAMM|nr:extensin family protein [Biostraticola tofi]TCV94336.1 hypothetical protein EDC52_10777 [Biostraticola tofi]